MLSKSNFSIYIVWAFLIVLYFPVFTQLYLGRWQMIDYTHAYFILPISLGLAYLNRSVLKPVASMKPQTAVMGLSLLGLGSLMFFFGWQQEYLFISTLSLVPVLFGLVLYFYGQRAVKKLSFPILYLLLLVPPPLAILDSITLPLRYGVSITTDIILKIFDIPIVRDGLLLSINGNEIYMGEPCSGLRSMVTMFALGLVYAYMMPLNTKNKVTLVLAIIPFALFGNLLRAVATCLSVYYFGPKMAEGPVHLITGLLIFILMMASFIAFEKHLEENEYDE